MNPMFLSFLKSMQTKSQDAQNPGLWVNGRRMPMQEQQGEPDLINQYVVPMVLKPAAMSALPLPLRAGMLGYKLGNDALDRAENNGSQYAQDLAQNRKDLETDPSVLQKQTEEEEQKRQKDVSRANPDLTGRMKQDPRNHARLIKSGDMTQQESDTLQGNNYNPGGIMSQMQENTNRSMFLTHLQGMQTKSQDAQNPGLWVNGRRMPMQEQQGAPTAAPATPAPYTKVIDTPEQKARGKEELRRRREIMNKEMKDANDKEQNYRRAHPSYLRPVITDPNEPKFIDPPNS